MTRTLKAILLTLGDPGQLTGGYLFHRRLAELAPRHNAQLGFVSFPQRPFPMSLADTPTIVREVEAQAPDVVVLDSIVAWCLAFDAPHTPMVGMLHQPPGGIDFGPLRTRAQAVLDRLAYRHLRRVLVASESLAEMLRPLGLQVAVVPPGRDVAPASGASPGDLRKDRKAAFLCVGNWVERKGILSLLNAFASLPCDAGTLHLVGRTNVEPRYTRAVWARLAQPELRERVIVHGALSIGDVAAMYAAADVFVLPSLKEPYGTVYGEAMAFGLPVVGWRAGNLPYLATNDVEGLIVPPDDLQALSGALSRLANEPDLRARMGQAARIRASSRPTWEEVAELFFGHLREVV